MSIFQGEGVTFYRCVLCRRIVSKWDIAKNSQLEPPSACSACGGRKISPCNLTWVEMLVQVIKHPALWRWNEEQQEPEEADDVLPSK